MKTVLITGSSSGFGLETAKYFLAHGWKVIATMRTPQADILPVSEHLRVLALDVTKAASIKELIKTVGQIDVLVNNAGIGLLGAIEGSSIETIREIFEVNTLGTIAMTQAILPQFRMQKSGGIINVTSSVTLKSLPLLAAYTASKAAINAFTESLALELQPFNIRVNIVLPGRSPGTKFGENAQSRMKDSIPQAYSELAKDVFASWQQESLITYSQDVVEAIWQAANDANSPMRIAAGADALALL